MVADAVDSTALSEREQYEHWRYWLHLLSQVVNSAVVMVTYNDLQRRIQVHVDTLVNMCIYMYAYNKYAHIHT